MQPRYPIMPKEHSRRIRADIRRVFLDVWDPIRIADEPNAQDEYDGYVGRAFELLTTGATDREIEEYLLWIVERMGMDGSRHSHPDVIDALRAIDLRDDSEPEIQLTRHSQE
jgi:hypothetical protein